MKLKPVAAREPARILMGGTLKGVTDKANEVLFDDGEAGFECTACGAQSETLQAVIGHRRRNHPLKKKTQTRRPAAVARYSLADIADRLAVLERQATPTPEGPPAPKAPNVHPASVGDDAQLKRLTAAHQQAVADRAALLDDVKRVTAERDALDIRVKKLIQETANLKKVIDGQNVKLDAIRTLGLLRD